MLTRAGLCEVSSKADCHDYLHLATLVSELWVCWSGEVGAVTVLPKPCIFALCAGALKGAEEEEGDAGGSRKKMKTTPNSEELARAAAIVHEVLLELVVEV